MWGRQGGHLTGCPPAVGDPVIEQQAAGKAGVLIGQLLAKQRSVIAWQKEQLGEADGDRRSWSGHQRQRRAGDLGPGLGGRVVDEAVTEKPPGGGGCVIRRRQQFSPADQIDAATLAAEHRKHPGSTGPRGVDLPVWSRGIVGGSCCQID